MARPDSPLTGTSARAVPPARSQPRAINLPGSKSLSHRMAILAALNRGQTTIREILAAEDIEITLTALRNMGAAIENRPGEHVRIKAPIGVVQKDDCYLGNSGSSARFLPALATMLDRPFQFHGSERLHQRPFKELFDALTVLGAKLESSGDSMPVTIHPQRLRGGRIALGNLPSSQIISGLMMAAAGMQNDLEIQLQDNIPSLPYVQMTIRLMKHLGLECRQHKNIISVAAGHLSTTWDYTVEKDMSAASYWVAYALINETDVVLQGVQRSGLQGDERIFDIAALAGATVSSDGGHLTISGGICHGFDVDCFDTPDLVPALAVIAMFAPEPVRLGNVRHLQHKESDRIAAIRKNLAVLGGKSEFDGNRLTIIPVREYRGGQIDSCNDHRIAMSFAIAGTRIPGVVIDNPDCVAKSYPAFWQDLMGE